MDLYGVRQQLNMGVPLTQMKLRVTDYSRVSTDHEKQKIICYNKHIKIGVVLWKKQKTIIH